jgi:hypothetical protein
MATGAKARTDCLIYAALKGRSSTVVQTFRMGELLKS